MLYQQLASLHLEQTPLRKRITSDHPEYNSTNPWRNWRDVPQKTETPSTIAKGGLVKFLQEHGYAKETVDYELKKWLVDQDYWSKLEDLVRAYISIQGVRNMICQYVGGIDFYFLDFLKEESSVPMQAGYGTIPSLFMNAVWRFVDKQVLRAEVFLEMCQPQRGKVIEENLLAEAINNALETCGLVATKCIAGSAYCECKHYREECDPSWEAQRYDWKNFDMTPFVTNHAKHGSKRRRDSVDSCE